ncbi:pumilio homolog 6, chloroplastic [Durio zibethinus]|uniref:Pumilio homolog 6, chloroplastic n=1 Tax=Durio zibethinus TaxID=66656 RepID=A0A6P5ZSS1_DURZI|nr:pumilio homolog 6, chloroplastic [Durio zibethinus]
MATESPIRISEMSGKWPTHQELAASSTNVAVEELGLLQTGHRFHASGTESVPNRSGSAPPSMEGSYLAIDNLISLQNRTVNVNSASLHSALEKCHSEEQLRADPAYLAYYRSNVSLNPRLPPRLISWGNQHLKRHNVRYGNNQVLSSIDDSASSFLHFSKGSLSTHKEVAEDDQSPQRSFDDLIERNNEFLSGQDATLVVGQHNESINLVEENFPCTSSPVYNRSQPLSYEITEVDYSVADYNSLLDPSIGVTNAVTSNLDGDMGLSSRADQTTLPSSSSSSNACTATTSSMPYLQKGVLHNRDIHLKDEVIVGNASGSDVSVIDSVMKDLNISTLRMRNSENHKNQEQKQHNYQNSLLQHQGQLQQPSNPFHVQTAKSQSTPQGVNGAYIGIDQFMQAPSKFSAEVQPVLQSSGFTPLYATAAGYMTTPSPFYPNVQAPGLHSPQYGVGGYGFNSSAVPPFITYPPYGAMPFVFDGSVGPNFNAQVPGVSSGGSIANGADMQHLNKFYGQFGYAVQSSFGDPLYMQCYQQPFGEAYGISGQYDPVARGGIVGSQNSAFDSQKGSNLAAYPEDQKIQHQQGGGSSNLPTGRGGLMSPHYLGNPQKLGMLMQYPSASLASPVMPGSQVAGTSVTVGKNESRFTTGSGIYSGWQGQRGFESSNDPKIYNFLEELKSGKGRRFELSDIVGRIVEFSADQHGSRFIQQKLENCSIEEKASVFKEVFPHASKLMTDVFGNYVIQKFFEYGSPEQRKELANKLSGQILNFSLQMYGCRVIQKALEVVDLEQKAQLVYELDGHVMRCVRDQNGNHVIQKCIESLPTDKIGFIISAFRGQVAILSTHPYGCRVIQRVLERCTDEQQCQFIVDEILESVCILAQDQYGNYVTQHVLEKGKPQERSKIISKLSGHFVQLSQHKFASNVIEKCLEYGGPSERELIVDEIVGHTEGNDNLLIMMKDQFANYVVQKIFDTCTENQQAILLSRIRLHAHALKKYTYGKHIVARFEQLFGEESQTTGS